MKLETKNKISMGCAITGLSIMVISAIFMWFGYVDFRTYMFYWWLPSIYLTMFGYFKYSSDNDIDLPSFSFPVHIVNDDYYRKRNDRE